MAGTRGRVKSHRKLGGKEGAGFHCPLRTCRPSTSPCLLKVLPPPDSGILGIKPLTRGPLGTQYSYCSSSVIQTQSFGVIFFNVCFKQDKEVR